MDVKNRLIEILEGLPEIFGLDTVVALGYAYNTANSRVCDMISRGLVRHHKRGSINSKALYEKTDKAPLYKDDNVAVCRNMKKRRKNPLAADLISVDSITISPLKWVSLCDQMLATFRSFSNQDKALLISTLFPIATEAELLAKFDELYPNYILPNVKEGDMLFHPLIGKVKIEKASPKKLGFYGNGQAWEADRNGHLIVNGKTHDRRTLFIDFADYQKYMEESMI